VNQQVLRAEAQRARQPDQGEAKNGEEHSQPRRVLRQTEMSAGGQVLPKAHFQEAQDAKQAHGGYGHDEPVHQRAGRSFGPALQSRQNARRLAEGEKGEQTARRILRQPLAWQKLSYTLFAETWVSAKQVLPEDHRVHDGEEPVVA
jgi:hypothetical protein